MNRIIAACTFLLCALQAHAAGFQSLDIPRAGATPMSVAIWYPSAAPTQATNTGVFTQDVAINAAVEGAGLPLIVITHGTGGSKYSHQDTALDLAKAGFVVIALTHPGDNYADQSAATDILERPEHVVAALDYMLKQWQYKDRIAPSRVGIFGFSAGGFTALVNIGGQPDMGKIIPHCVAQPEQFVCALIAKGGQRFKLAQMAATARMHDQRIRAAVIASPGLGFTFDAAALRKVDIPLQLWHAEDDAILPYRWHAGIVRGALVRQPDYQAVPHAGHFDFLAPCAEKLAAIAPEICTSQEGFDRAQFHRRFNAGVIAHFKKFL